MTGTEIALLVFGVWLFGLTLYAWVVLESRINIYREHQKIDKEHLEKRIASSRERTIDNIEDLTLKLNDLRENVLDGDDYNNQRLNALMDYLDLYVRENNSVELVKRGKK